MLHCWFKLCLQLRVKVIYVDSRMAGCWESDRNPDQVRQVMEVFICPRFQHNFSVRPEVEKAPIPAVFLVLYANHFFGVAIDFERRIVFVMGRSTDRAVKRDKWNEWNGPRYYEHICQLFGWDGGDPGTVDVRSVHLVQNGIDCGPQAAMAMEYVFKSGLTFDAGGNLVLGEFDCTHTARARMHKALHEVCKTSLRDYYSWREEPPVEWYAYEEGEGQLAWDDIERDVVDEVEGPTGAMDADVVAKLDAAKAKCRACRKAHRLVSFGEEGLDTQQDAPLPPKRRPVLASVPQVNVFQRRRGRSTRAALPSGTRNAAADSSDSDDEGDDPIVPQPLAIWHVPTQDEGVQNRLDMARA